MVTDQSVDFAFSVDSLIHADDTVLRAYLQELSRVLTRNGVAFLHHSNLGQYSTILDTTKKLGIQDFLMRHGILEKNIGWRDQTVDASRVEWFAQEFGMLCISQETINWLTKRTLNDCFSVITRKDSALARKNQILQNHLFDVEVTRTFRLYNFG
jgi:hypothetical protein